MRSETIRPAYVIGADGYDSAVRRMTGIEMAEHGAAHVFSIYEIEATGELPAEARVIFDPDLTSVYWPLEKGRCRWGFQIRDAAAHAHRWSGRAADRREGPLVHGAADADLLVDAWPVRVTPDAELRQGRRMARRGRRAPGTSSRDTA